MSWPSVEFPEAIRKTKVGRENQILSSDIQTSGHFPVIDQGQAFVAGYSDDEGRVIRDDLPLVIFGDHTRCLKYVDFPFILGADGTKVLKPKEDLFDTKFFYYALLSLDIPNRGYNRHFTALKEKTVPCPEKDLQRRIATVLGVVQQAIEQQERLLALTAELKKTLLHQHFTQELNDVDDVYVHEALVKFKIEQDRQLPSSQIKEQGHWPVIDQGQSFIAGYTDEEDKVINNEPLIIFGDHTRCVKFVDFPFVIGADGTKVLKADETKFRPRFLYYALAALDIPNRGYNRHFILLKEKQIKRPDFDIQDAAIERFVALDRKVSIHQRKHAALTDLFHTLLHELMTAQIRVHDLDLPELEHAQNG